MLKRFFDLDWRKWLGYKTSWGHDEEGDLTLKIGPLFFTYYKWKEAIVRTKDKIKFCPLDDTSSQEFWKKSMKRE